MPISSTKGTPQNQGTPDKPSGVPSFHGTPAKLSEYRYFTFYIYNYKVLIIRNDIKVYVVS